MDACMHLWARKFRLPIPPRTARVARCVRIRKFRPSNLTRCFNIRFTLVTNICIVVVNQIHCQLVQDLEIIRSVGDFDWLPAQPIHIFSTRNVRIFMNIEEDYSYRY